MKSLTQFMFKFFAPLTNNSWFKVRKIHFLTALTGYIAIICVDIVTVCINNHFKSIHTAVNKNNLSHPNAPGKVASTYSSELFLLLLISEINYPCHEVRGRYHIISHMCACV